MDADGKADTATTGGIVGTFAGGTLGQDAQNKVFFAAKDASTGKSLVQEGITAVGNASTGATPANAEGLSMQDLTKSEKIGWSDGKNVMDDKDAQNDDWIAYNNQTAPLLKTFMNFIKIKRQYQYDGTVHNLITSDVDNYYGGAFFASDRDAGYGKNVFTKGVDVVKDYENGDWQIATGSADANVEHSSEYKYDKSDLWSPQHGYYYTDADASVIITPEPVKIKVENVTKTYGQLTKGYVYKYVPEGEGAKPIYYTYDKATDKWTSSTEEPMQGTTYIITLEHTEKDKDGKDVKVNGLANENNENVNPTTQLKGLAFLKAEIVDYDGKKTDKTTSGASDLSVTPGDDIANRMQRPDTSYTLNLVGFADGKTAEEYQAEENYNYDIDFSEETKEVDEENKAPTKSVLNVLKPTIYFTAEGSREYGSDTTMGTLKLIVQANTLGSGEDNDFDNGRLNPWDIPDSSQNLDRTYDLSTSPAAIKDKDGKIIGFDLSKMTFYTGPQKATDKVTILAKEQAKNGIKAGSGDGTAEIDNHPVIDAKTWVNGSGKEPLPYTIAAGSFLDKDGNTVFQSDLYNLVYLGNKKDAKDAEFGKYTITPVKLIYDITGYHTYGETPNKEKPAYELAADPGDLMKNGDKITDVVNAGNAQDLVKEIFKDNDINADTHVKRDAAGKVIPYKEVGIVFDADHQDERKSTANALTPNYVLTSGRLNYRIDPAKAIFTVNNNEKTYGETTLTPDSGKLELYKGTEAKATGGEVTATYDVDAAGTATLKTSDVSEQAKIYEDATKKNDLTADYQHAKAKDGDTEKELTDATLGVKYAEDGETIDAYKGVLSAKDKSLYLNDYEITYKTGDFTVRPKNLTVNAGDATKVYGDENTDKNVTFSDVTFDGLEEHDKEALGGKAGQKYFGTKLTDKATGITKTSAAGTTIDGATTLVDKSLQDKDGNAIKKAESAYKNYTINPKDGTAPKEGTETVIKRKLKFAADDAKTTYGQTPTFTGTFSNFAGDDVTSKEEQNELAKAFADGGNENYAVKDGEGKELRQQDAGQYTVGAKKDALEQALTNWNNKNYELDDTGVKDGTWTVNKARLDITADGARSYGEKNDLSQLTIQAKNQNDATADDSADNGALKSWDATRTAGDIKKLAGYAAATDKDVTLLSKEEAQNGIAAGGQAAGTSTTIDEKTWVKTDADGNIIAYDLAEGSLKDAFTSKNYDIHFVGGESADGKVQGKYTVNPAELTYDVTGGHVYGSDPDAKAGAGEAAKTQLKNGDTLANVISDDNVKAFAQNVLDANHIDKTTHVRRDADGNVVALDTSKAETPTATTRDTLTPNYALKLGNLDYTVTPADLTVQAGSAEKTYGDATFQTTDVTFTGFQNDDAVKLSHYYKTRAADDLQPADTNAGDYKGQTQAFIEEGDKGKFSDYNIVSETNGDAVIHQADLTIKAGNATRDAGKDNDAFAYEPVTFQGFRFDRDRDAIGGTFQTKLAPDASFDATTPSGTYAGQTYAGAMEAVSNGDEKVYRNYRLNDESGDSLKNYRLHYEKGDVIIRSPWHPSPSSNGGGSTTPSQENRLEPEQPITPDAENRLLPGEEHADPTAPGREGHLDAQTNDRQPDAFDPARWGTTPMRDPQQRKVLTQVTGNVTSQAEHGESSEDSSLSKKKLRRTQQLPADIDGGNRKVDGLRASRFLTLEDTVIRVSDVVADLGDLVIDASSRTDGGDTVVLDQKGLDLTIYGTQPLQDGTTVDTASTDIVLHDEETPDGQETAEDEKASE